MFTTNANALSMSILYTLAFTSNLFYQKILFSCYIMYFVYAVENVSACLQKLPSSYIVVCLVKKENKAKIRKLETEKNSVILIEKRFS